MGRGSECLAQARVFFPRETRSPARRRSRRGVGETRLAPLERGRGPPYPDPFGFAFGERGGAGVAQALVGIKTRRRQRGYARAARCKYVRRECRKSAQLRACARPSSTSQCTCSSGTVFDLPRLTTFGVLRTAKSKHTLARGCRKSATPTLAGYAGEGGESLRGDSTRPYLRLRPEQPEGVLAPHYVRHN